MLDNEERILLSDIKKDWFLNYSKNSSEIAELFKREYKKYVDDPVEYDNKEEHTFNFDSFIENCDGMKPQLIPYSALTEIIFKNDMSEESLNDKQINETNFANIIEKRFELYLIKKYRKNKIRKKDEITPFTMEEDEINEDQIRVNKEKIIICYKIIEHLKLAISQKEGLYEKQKFEITKLEKRLSEVSGEIDKSSKKLKKVKRTYDNITTQYISILGIFAAILMTAFGGIQTFTAIFQNKKFSLEDSLLIACVGFMGVILLLFMLMNGIAKLTGKTLNSGHKSEKWYFRHPTLINSFILLSTFILIILTWKLIKNPELFSPSYFWFIIPIGYSLIMFVIFNVKSKQ
ncbi:hypothetical protein [Mammaliicoccus sp. JADD-157]|uniref:hypothetical protein n=1 Tax=Mammaliicoccus sp. JADD-157 TaxID=3404818 RepID=UPI003BB56A12